MANRPPGASPQNYGGGVYPGSGVASGGRQGKFLGSRQVAGKRGGSTPGANQKLVYRNGKIVNPYFDRRKGNESKQNVRLYREQIGQLNRTIPGAITNPRPPGAQAPAPAIPGAAAPNVAGFLDPTYYDELRMGQGDLDAQLNPLLSEAAGLRTTGVDGKTLYDRLYEKAQRQFGQNVNQTQTQFFSDGVRRSGAFDLRSGELSSDFLGESDQLYNTYGLGRLQAIEQQEKQMRSQFEQQRALLARAAAAREQQQRLAELSGYYNPFYEFEE